MKGVITESGHSIQDYDKNKAEPFALTTFVQIYLLLHVTIKYVNRCENKELGPIVRRVDNFIQLINPYPEDKIGAFLILIGQRANFIHWIYPPGRVIHSSYNRAQTICTNHFKIKIYNSPNISFKET